MPDIFAVFHKGQDLETYQALIYNVGTQNFEFVHAEGHQSAGALGG